MPITYSQGQFNTQTKICLRNLPVFLIIIVRCIPSSKCTCFILYNKLVICLTHQPNTAGQRFMDLVHGEWKSSITQSIEAFTTYNVTAFMGDYVMNVKRNGQVVLQRNFTLDSTGKDITIYAGACMDLYVKYSVAFDSIILLMYLL